MKKGSPKAVQITTTKPRRQQYYKTDDSACENKACLEANIVKSAFENSNVCTTHDFYYD